MKPISNFVTAFVLAMHSFVPSVAAYSPSSASLFSRAANVSCGADPRMPTGSWDSHLHIMDPVRYPPVPDIPYVPGVYTVWDNAIFERNIGCDHVFFVQTATHGYDLTLMLDSLRAYGNDKALGLALFDPNITTPSHIEEWNELGVRAVRVNLVTYGDSTPIDELKAQITQYVELIRPYGWVLQLYTKMATIPDLEDFLPTLGVRVVFDHYGDPTLPENSATMRVDPYAIEGFSALVRLLQTGTTWVKISGAYRFSRLENSETWEDLDPITRELFAVGRERIVFGSDWPHTRFDGLNIKPWVGHMLDLTEGDEELRNNLFRDNALELWGVRKPGCSARR